MDYKCELQLARRILYQFQSHYDFSKDYEIQDSGCFRGHHLFKAPECIQKCVQGSNSMRVEAPGDEGLNFHPQAVI